MLLSCLKKQSHEPLAIEYVLIDYSKQTERRFQPQSIKKRYIFVYKRIQTNFPCIKPQFCRQAKPYLFSLNFF